MLYFAFDSTPLPSLSLPLSAVRAAATALWATPCSYLRIGLRLRQRMTQPQPWSSSGSEQAEGMRGEGLGA